MEAFSYQQHHPFFLDSAYYPNTPMEMPPLPHQVGELTNAASCFPYYSGATPEFSATDESQMSYSSAVVQSHVGEETLQVSMEKKRKNWNGTSLSSGQSKDSKGSKNRRQRKPSGKLKEAEKKHKGGDLKATKACEESPEGYIHLRARRGQATDSHSLAERVRREKISERMKLLQGLVPGCEQVTGKALVLDEIINYVQSLQNQVEFLSMELASMNPIIYDLGEHYDGCMIQQEKMGSMQQPGPSGFENATNNYPMVDSSASFLPHGQVPTTLSQDNKSLLVQVGDHRQVFIDQAEFSNMCSFQ